MQSIIVDTMPLDSLRRQIKESNVGSRMVDSERDNLKNPDLEAFIIPDIFGNDEDDEDTDVLILGIGKSTKEVTYSSINLALDKLNEVLRICYKDERDLYIEVRYPKDIMVEYCPLKHFTISALKLKPTWRIELKIE